MRGGTSKGAYFVSGDLPAASKDRDELLLRVMGSGHPLQIDGIGGAHPLSSKVAVVSEARDVDADVDYLFLQLGVEDRVISARQNCGNILAGVGPFAVERGLVAAGRDHTAVRIRMLNSGSLVTATFATPGGRVHYGGATRLSGVPGSAAPITLRFADTAGATTGSLLPTGQVRDLAGEIEVSCVDNGMPVVVARASDLGVTGYESPGELARDGALRDRVQALRVEAGALMGLGDVHDVPIPKTTLVAAPTDGGSISTRTFIPLEVHTSIGVFGALSAATALRLPGGVGSELMVDVGDGHLVDVEHPSGHMLIDLDVDGSASPPAVLGAGVVRTARKIFDGTIYPVTYAEPETRMSDAASS